MNYTNSDFSKAMIKAVEKDRDVASLAQDSLLDRLGPITGKSFGPESRPSWSKPSAKPASTEEN